MNSFSTAIPRSKQNYSHPDGCPKRGFALLAAFFLVFAASSPCASAKGGEADPVHDIKLRGIATELFENIDTVELLNGEQHVGDLSLSSNQLKMPSPVTSREFTLGVTVEGKFRPLGNVSLPQEGKSFILVCVPNKNGYVTHIVRTDDPDFHGNDVYVFNSTKHQIGIVLGTADQQNIDPEKNARLSPMVDADAKSYIAQMKYEKEGALITFFNARWPVDRNTRSLIIVYQQPDDGRVMFRSFTDVVEP